MSTVFRALRFLRIGMTGWPFLASTASRMLSASYPLSAMSNRRRGQIVRHHQVIAGVVRRLTRGDLRPHGQAPSIDPEVDLCRNATFRAAKTFLLSPFFDPAACWWAELAPFSTGHSSMTMGPNDGAVDHLYLFRGRAAVVERLQDQLPQPRQRPTPELPIHGRPLAELRRQVPPSRSRTCDPEDPVQCQPRIGRPAPVRLPHGIDEKLVERPFRVRHQVPRQDRPPRGSDLESRLKQDENPVCQRGLVL